MYAIDRSLPSCYQHTSNWACISGCSHSMILLRHGSAGSLYAWPTIQLAATHVLLHPSSMLSQGVLYCKSSIIVASHSHCGLLLQCSRKTFLHQQAQDPSSVGSRASRADLHTPRRTGLTCHIIILVFFVALCSSFLASCQNSTSVYSGSLMHPPTRLTWTQHAYMFCVPSVWQQQQHSTCFNLKQQRGRFDRSTGKLCNGQNVGRTWNKPPCDRQHHIFQYYTNQCPAVPDRIATTYDDDDSGLETYSTGVVQCKRPNKSSEIHACIIR